MRTSDLQGAGTDGDVTLELLSTSGASSGPRPLCPPRGGAPPFARGGADEFELAAPQLGELAAAVVAHDGRGAGAGWHLEQVRGARGGREAAGRRDEHI